MKKDYMTRLERAVRWRLPPQEAEDVIADYREIVGNPPRSEEELHREVGDPEQAVKLLTSPLNAYRVWLLVFGLMAACILIPGASPHGPFWWLWDACFGGPYGGGWGIFHIFSHWGPILAGIGLVVSLVWFRRQGRKAERFPKAVKLWLAVLTVWLAVVFLIALLALRDPQGFLAMWGEVPLTYFGIPIMGGMMVPMSTQILTGVLQHGGTLVAILGVYALVRARTEDRRWTAVYILALGTMLVSMEFLALFTAMDPTTDFLSVGWYLPGLGWCAACAAVGYVGAGASLC